MSYFQTQAVTLSRQIQKEDDQIVTLYTKDFGKLQTIVTGAKKIKSKLAGHIEPFNILEAYIVNVRSHKLIGAQMITHYGRLRQSLEKIGIAGFCVRLVNELTGLSQPDERIFWLIKNMFDILEGARFSLNQDMTKSIFIWKLLSFLGYAPELQKCVLCKENIAKGEANGFSPQKGGLVCAPCKVDFHCIGISDTCITLLRSSLVMELGEVLRIGADTKTMSRFQNLSTQFLEFRM